MAPVANIGLVERRKRHRAGVVLLLLGAAVALAISTEGPPVALRAVSAALFFVGFLGIFQARARTCVALAARGVRDMDAGAEAVTNPAELTAARAQARRVLAQTAIATIVATAVALLL